MFKSEMYKVIPIGAKKVSYCGRIQVVDGSRCCFYSFSGTALYSVYETIIWANFPRHTELI